MIRSVPFDVPRFPLPSPRARPATLRPVRPLPLLVLLAACASATPAPVGPEAAVQAWADGLRAKDAEAVWALLGPPADALRPARARRYIRRSLA